MNLAGVSSAVLIGGLVFSGIGFAAFVYGRKQSDTRSLVIGIALMCLPFFISQAAVFYAVGAVLTAALFLFRS